MRRQFRTSTRLRRGACALALCLAPAVGVAEAAVAGGWPAAGAAGALPAEGPAGHAARAPRLVLVSRDPVKVAGSRFGAHERVRVTVVARSTQTRKLTTNAHGTFTTTFGMVVIDRCSAWSVTAVQRGHAPVVIRGAKPQCPPA